MSMASYAVEVSRQKDTALAYAGVSIGLDGGGWRLVADMKSFKVPKGVKIGTTLVGKIEHLQPDRLYREHDGRTMIPKSAVGLHFRGGDAPHCSSEQAIWRGAKWAHDSTNPFDIVGYVCQLKR